MTAQAFRRSLVLALFIVASASVGQGASQQHWVSTWAASAQSARIVFPRLPAPPPPAPGAAAPPNRPLIFPPAPSFDNQTVRMIVRSSIGGHRVRVQLSNAFGSEAVRIGAAHIALRDKDSAIVAGSDRPLTFGGDASAIIPAGAELLSDPVDLDVPPVADLAVSIFLPGHVEDPTDHLTGLHTTYISGPGDFTGAPAIADATTKLSWYLLSSVDVLAPADTSVIVAFGDSITDGATSTPDTDRSWPSQLAQRLAANKATQKFAIVNEGISGNRLMDGGMGIAALARFDRDVLSVPGVKYVIVMLGINDIGLGSLPGTPPDQQVTAQELIDAHKQLIAHAHIRGIRAIGATLTPYVGAAYASAQGEVIREAVNDWIRTSHAYDAVFDFDAVVRDPANPKQILPSLNLTDHLHPDDAGYKAMADSVDLSIFTSLAKLEIPPSQ
ncbi:MAG TPA: SGNH/GDSL hydrolase family protein [Candidatus Acidoferrales bacterium]|jgi:lysophospholipase L1-like esterase|nr:SGNH/GDSL hydrolase family protein [Candidatus Acidoferrales bacterium]